jgi:ribonucleoside-triphosphate reductase
LTINFSKKYNKEGKAEIVDKTFLKDICKLDIFRYNIFTSEGSKVSSCCRLLSNSEMLGLASQANSFGAGGSISLGSHRVITINFMRIAIEAKTEKEFYEILEERINSCIKILIAHKKLLMTTKDKKLQKFLSNGWINFNRLFSTIGVLGIYECSKLYNEKFNIDKNIDTTKNILTFLNTTKSNIQEKFNEKKDKDLIVINVEQIPGESFAVRLAKVDKILFGEEVVPYEMYANQFVPLWEKVSVWERMEIAGGYDKLLDGGGICHVTIGEKITSKQAEKLIKFAVDSGCEHFALNAIYSECTNNHTSLGKYEKCPICGEQIIEYYSRIVGFFTPISSWNPTRREWEFPKRYIQDNSEIENKEI